MCVTLGSHRIQAPHKPDRPPKRKSRSEFGTSLWQAGSSDAAGFVHGAPHDKPDDKLNIIKYYSNTRYFGGQQT
jgi:hypothetical protein